MTLTVEVVYALAQSQTVIPLQLPANATVADALEASGIFEQHPEIDTGCAVGVWGRVVERTHLLRDRDRIEIYRPLTADPKQARRARAAVERKRRV